MEEFAGAFGDADAVQVLDIYAASEAPIEGITGETLAAAIRAKGGGRVCMRRRWQRRWSGWWRMLGRER